MIEKFISRIVGSSKKVVERLPWLWLGGVAAMGAGIVLIQIGAGSVPELMIETTRDAVGNLVYGLEVPADEYTGELLKQAKKIIKNKEWREAFIDQVINRLQTKHEIITKNYPKFWIELKDLYLGKLTSIEKISIVIGDMKEDVLDKVDQLTEMQNLFNNAQIKVKEITKIIPKEKKLGLSKLISSIVGGMLVGVGLISIGKAIMEIGKELK